MPPNKLGNKFKTVKVVCNNGHEVARYRKPKSEWGERTHKLWLLEERLARLSTQPPLFDIDQITQEERLSVPETGTEIACGDDSCTIVVGKIAVIGGTVALELAKNNLRPTKG